MPRTPLFAGNWKMHKNVVETLEFLEAFLRKAKDVHGEIAFCPPFTSLWAAAERLKGSGVKIGAQNMHWEDKGAFTGEISPAMLKEIPCDYVIIGHSERRQYFNETDETVNRKVKAALKYAIKPIICVGESLEQREKGKTLSVVLSQVERALEGVDIRDGKELVFAYEPVWAIGTGKVALPSDAQEVIGAIRNKLSELYGARVSQNIRILYGGSVKPENVRDLMAEPDIDGALVGGASLDADTFYRIAAYDQG
ncbi:triose-phosphate isomerase [Thermosediminibacter oceani]|uniref:Triosephosphate isomerase n=1 Tax=Thermosediminibacter oceani (strain ATCC BAA-1034 / DSM 16646 / JW/IW-1228P) TaxID=555079 RepID=D9RZ28_THEOJ|nr:triose-phosphate isomerase [Thermosediminibacter oceani]ADL08582.1 triosephosphate isomerase [Thermosediminibacter oceani DSM 16646]